MDGFTINKICLGRKVIFIVLVIFLLASSFSIRTSAIVISPGSNIIVENEMYTVNQTMTFESITIASSYIIFNDTGFYLTSGNDITITLVYINSDISGAGDGEKVLEFYGDTSAGSVVFDLSGFPAGNDYTVNRSGSSIATPTANGSGFISFTNSVWSSQLFEIFQVGEGVVNSPPVVSNIPDQTILEGASFAQINLDNYVTDVEDPDDDIDWSYSGNTGLLVSIVNRVATISTPSSNWYGVETITFTAEDTGGLTDSDDVTCTVTALNDPPVVSNIPDQTILEGASFAQINLDNYVTDVEDPDDDIDWSYSDNTGLLVSIVNRVATISTPSSNWYGVETITFTAEDTGGLTDSDDVTFTVTAHDAPFFSGLSISSGATEVSIGTTSLGITIEDPDGDSIDWTIETSPSIGSNSGSGESNGSKSCSISGLAYSTTYTWFVNATDGTHWTNGSYTFTTEAAPSPNPPGGGSSPGGGGYVPPAEGDNGINGNIPPDTPIKPSGPTLIEMEVDYMYSSSTVDVDGDEIRFRFDWSDGNYSDWSEFVASNTSISMSHYWASISTFEVRILAQDENGLNSSWSLPLDVTVSQNAPGEVPPIADIKVPSDVSVNQTIVFDASGSFDEDGVIVSYYWDFGDGENGSGINPSHVYKDPGQYNVTLVVTDNNGITYSKSIIVNIASKEESSEEKQGGLQFDFGTIFIGFAMILLACLAVFFRDDIKSFVSKHYVHLFSHVKIFDKSSRIKRIDAKIKEKERVIKSDFTQPPVGMRDIYSDEIQDRYDRIRRYIDSEIAPISDTLLDGYDRIYSGEKVDKLIDMGLKPDKLPVETGDIDSFKEDIRSTIDRLILPDYKKSIREFDSGFPKSDSIERMVDDLFISKMRQKIDTL